jgi:5-methylcytosine-specific restriction endonuclease McrA
MNIGVLIVERNVIQDSPEYQREAGVWSPEKQQLFLDSIFNNMDIPKIYFHDLRGTGGARGKFNYAVIDGKQRLHAIWDFVDGNSRLAEDFELREKREGHESPKGGSRFQDLTQQWQEIFKSKTLDIVLIQNAKVEDIEELFSRLNNGEPLNAAEKRNAIGGAMCKLIRDTAEDRFFKAKVPSDNTRYQHYELSAKLILIEKSQHDGGDGFCDLKKKFLDKLAKDNKVMSPNAIKELHDLVSIQLNTVSRIFIENDPLLSKQAAIPVYYLFTKVMVREYAAKDLYSWLKKFLQDFNSKRLMNLERPEEERDPVLLEFGRLMQQGTNDLNSLRSRVSILRRFFLIDYPDTPLRDKKREFTEEERIALFYLSARKCQKCATDFGDISEMEADHKAQWAHGGPTSLKNGRALCGNCNKAEAKRVS